MDPVALAIEDAVDRVGQISGGHPHRRWGLLVHHAGGKPAGESSRKCLGAISDLRVRRMTEEFGTAPLDADNGQEIPTPHGAPVRLRVARQLGHKSVKYLSRITVIDILKNIGKGLGSSSPEVGYSWYAGI